LNISFFLISSSIVWNLETRMRRCQRLLVIFFVVVFAACAVNAQIPSPESQLGFKIGEDRKLADWQQVTDYFQKVSTAAPDRVRFEELGKSTLGKPFVALTISSPQNLQNLQRYLQIQQRLADPRGLSDAEADKLITDGKAVVLITCTVHSTEVASTQTAMEYVYKLLTEDTPEHREILDNVIFLLIPSLNPDGQDMVVKWYRKYVGTPYEGAQPVELYHPYVGHDDNRDWYMFTQVESQLTVGRVQNVWHPEVVYDVHQMGSYSARLFVPPFLDPIDPNVDPLLVQETNALGTSMAADLASAGKTGVAVNAIYDFWSPARHYQAYHGGLRVLTESASVRIASPMRIRFEDLDTNALGYNARQASWNFPDPWKGGEWKLRDIVDYQLIAYESVLHHVAQNRAQYVRNFYQLGKRALVAAGPFAYVIPADQKDAPAAAKMLNTLRFGMVEVRRAKDKFTADGIEYPAGSYVILMAQPYGRYAKTLLERQRYPDLREYPGGPPKRPYDVTAQTLPLLMGVKAVEVAAPLKGDFELVDKIEPPVTKVDSKAKQFLLRSDSDYAFLAVNRLLKQGVPVARLHTAVKDRGTEFPAGTFVVRSAAIAQIAPQLGLVAAGTDLPLADAAPLKTPRIGIYNSYIPSMDEGWTRWLLEQFEFPYMRLHDKDIRGGDLRAKYDVIIVPDQSANAIVEGIPRANAAGGEPAAQGRAGRGFGFSGPMPDEFTGGIGRTGVNNLRTFVLQGGTLVALNDASGFAIDRLGVNARNVLREAANKDFYGPGSILRVNVDPNHPIGYGMDRDTAIWFEHSPAFAATFVNSGADPVTVASYPDGNPLMSGWLLGDSLLYGRSAVLDAPLGRGHAVLFGFRPQYRGQSYGTFKLFFNSLYYFGEQEQAPAAAPGKAQ
jgi:hypothetical protein